MVNSLTGNLFLYSQMLIFLQKPCFISFKKWNTILIDFLLYFYKNIKIPLLYKYLFYIPDFLKYL